MFGKKEVKKLKLEAVVQKNVVELATRTYRLLLRSGNTRTIELSDTVDYKGVAREDSLLTNGYSYIQEAVDKETGVTVILQDGNGSSIYEYEELKKTTRKVLVSIDDGFANGIEEL